MCDSNENEHDTERDTVSCDTECGAYDEPSTLEEYEKTLKHYKFHSYLGGCSYGC